MLGLRLPIGATDWTVHGLLGLGLPVGIADRTVHGLLWRVLHDGLLGRLLLGRLLLEGNQGNGSSVSHNLSHSKKRK